MVFISVWWEHCLFGYWWREMQGSLKIISPVFCFLGIGYLLWLLFGLWCRASIRLFFGLSCLEIIWFSIALCVLSRSYLSRLFFFSAKSLLFKKLIFNCISHLATLKCTTYTFFFQFYYISAKYFLSASCPFIT